MTKTDENSTVKFKGQTEMNDASIAREFIKDIGGEGYVSTVISVAARYLDKRFPHQGEPHKRWTERRLVAWWKGETEVVRFWQMAELHDAAKAKKEEKKLIEEARNEHRKFIEANSRLAGILERTDPTFFSAQVEALRSQNGSLDRTRNNGTGRD